jgi:hypothetical protein
MLNDVGVPVDVNAVGAQLARIMSSRHFAASERLQSFLRFVVEQEMSGRAGELKEYTIGVQVYRRPASFDPKADSIVRSEARRLRSRLVAYYDGEGAQDPVLIALPVGRYVPQITYRPQALSPEEPLQRGAQLQEVVTADEVVARRGCGGAACHRNARARATGAASVRRVE